MHLCCIGLDSGSTEFWLQTSQLCRQHDRVHCVLLIVQPLECADDAGFTLVQSHCCTLHSGPVRLSCSPSYFYMLYFYKFVSYAKFLGNTPAAELSRTLMQKYSHASKPMNKSACSKLTYICHKFSPCRESGSQVRWKKKKRGGGVKGKGEIFENEKSLCVSRAHSQTVQVPRGEAIEARARETEKTITSHLVWEWRQRKNRKMPENVFFAMKRR